MEAAALPPWLERDSEGQWRVAVWAQPGGRRSEILGERDGCLKIRLAAPAVENKANQELLAFLARMIGLKPGHLSLSRGEKGRRKTVRVAAGHEPDFTALTAAANRENE